MTKFKYTGTTRGVTPMGKTPLQNLPRRTAYAMKLTKVAAQTVLGGDWIAAVYPDEIVSEVKK